MCRMEQGKVRGWSDVEKCTEFTEIMFTSYFGQNIRSQEKGKERVSYMHTFALHVGIMKARVFS